MSMNTNRKMRITKMLRATLLMFVSLVLLAVPAVASDVYLVAKEFDKTMPDLSVVRMWGYALATGRAYPAASVCTDAGLVASSPGPEISVLPGDSSVRIYLTNCLPEPTSIVIPGQEMPYSGGTGPTWTDNTVGLPYRPCSTGAELRTGSGTWREQAIRLERFP